MSLSLSVLVCSCVGSHFVKFGTFKEKCFKGVSRVFLECFKELSRKIKGILKDVCRKVCRCC